MKQIEKILLKLVFDVEAVLTNVFWLRESGALAIKLINDQMIIKTNLEKKLNKVKIKTK